MATRYTASDNEDSQRKQTLRTNYFKEWREHKGVSQKKLAKLMRISPSSVYRVENGVTPFTQDFLEGYAAALGITALALQMSKPKEAERYSRLADMWATLPADQQLGVLKLIGDISGPRKETAQLNRLLKTWKKLRADQRDVLGWIAIEVKFCQPDVTAQIRQIWRYWGSLDPDQRERGMTILQTVFPDTVKEQQQSPVRVEA
jgi:transcriptional regulator with XRE-family HTH domain